MPCKTCKYWHYIGCNSTTIGGIFQETEVGACHNTETLDAIIRTEQEELTISLTVLLGVTTGLVTKEHFECFYFEPTKPNT